MKRGQLLILPPTAPGAKAPAVGIRFDAPNRLMALALTPFRQGRYPAGDAVDLSMDTSVVLALDAALTIEADLVAEVTSHYDREFAPGELVDAQEGLGVAAFFGRYNPAVISGAATIDLSTWALRQRETVRMIFGGWRLRIEVPDQKPIYWKPNFAVVT